MNKQRKTFVTVYSENLASIIPLITEIAFRTIKKHKIMLLIVVLMINIFHS